MGVDFTHCQAHWSYSGFNKFRIRICNDCGFPGDPYSNSLAEVANHPIAPFIIHSDCDGYWSVEEMKQIVPVLKRIIAKWPKDDYDTFSGLELIRGMEAAISANERMSLF